MIVRDGLTVSATLSACHIGLDNRRSGGNAMRCRWGYVPWQQRFDIFNGFGLRQVGADTAQIGVGLQAVCFGGFNQAVEACGSLGAGGCV